MWFGRDYELARAPADQLRVARALSAKLDRTGVDPCTVALWDRVDEAVVRLDALGAVAATADGAADDLLDALIAVHDLGRFWTWDGGVHRAAEATVAGLPEPVREDLVTAVFAVDGERADHPRLPVCAKHPSGRREQDRRAVGGRPRRAAGVG